MSREREKKEEESPGGIREDTVGIHIPRLAYSRRTTAPVPGNTRELTRGEEKKRGMLLSRCPMTTGLTAVVVMALHSFAQSLKCTLCADEHVGDEERICKAEREKRKPPRPAADDA